METKKKKKIWAYGLILRYWIAGFIVHVLHKLQLSTVFLSFHFLQ